MDVNVLSLVNIQSVGVVEIVRKTTLDLGSLEAANRISALVFPDVIKDPDAGTRLGIAFLGRARVCDCESVADDIGPRFNDHGLIIAPAVRCGRTEDCGRAEDNGSNSGRGGSELHGE